MQMWGSSEKKQMLTWSVSVWFPLRNVKREKQGLNLDGVPMWLQVWIRHLLGEKRVSKETEEKSETWEGWGNSKVSRSLKREEQLENSCPGLAPSTCAARVLWSWGKLKMTVIDVIESGEKTCLDSDPDTTGFSLWNFGKLSDHSVP